MGARALLLLASLTLGGAASAQQPEPVDDPAAYPDHPGREETVGFCTACHGFGIVAAQGMSRERWNETLDVMVTRHNMPDVQGADREKVLDYLAGAFPQRTQRPGWKSPFAE